MTDSEQREQKTDVLLEKSEQLRVRVLELADLLDGFVDEFRREVRRREEDP